MANRALLMYNLVANLAKYLPLKAAAATRGVGGAGSRERRTIPQELFRAFLKLYKKSETTFFKLNKF